MKIHEYQAKEIFRKYNVTVPEGRAAFTPEEVESIAKELGGVVVVKAQIHAGGRGKGKITDSTGKELGGGVRICKTVEDAKKAAADMLNNTLTTIQTGPEGTTVKRVMVEQGLEIERELYAGLVLDRETSKVTMMVSTEGGMEIEEVAKNTPEKIIKESIEPLIGLGAFQARKLCFKLGLEGKIVNKGVAFLQRLYNVVADKDASLVEINPLVVTKQGDLVALDAKMNFDSNSMYKHKDILEYRDLDEEDAKEVEASKFELNYISLDGNIGCMVNGAGLAMATMDSIKLHGGEPANFLDVGGGATTETVTAAFKIILSDKNVKGVLVNIFGGIMKCDVVAEGVVAAAKDVGLNIPLVVRLEGTNVEAGKKILESSDLNIITADGMKDAADKAVKSVN